MGSQNHLVRVFLSACRLAGIELDISLAQLIEHILGP